MLFQSFGGGTGSGLGSRLLEEVKRNYTKSFLTTVGILPGNGNCGSPLQVFNTTFSLAWAYEFTDTMILYDNDLLLSHSASRVDSSSGRGVTTGFGLMNRIITDGLGSLLNREGFDLGRFLSTLSPLPSHKMVQLFTARPEIPRNCKNRSVIANNWDVLAGISKTLPPNYKYQKATGVLASELTLRGLDTNPIRLPYIDHLGLSPVQWNPSTELVVRDGMMNSGVATATLALNWCQAAARIAPVLSTSESKWRKRCFVHWYNEQGVTDTAFDAALETAKKCIHSYFTADM